MRLTDDATLPGRALVPLRQFRETMETLRAEALALGVAAARGAHARGDRLRGRARPRGHRRRTRSGSRTSPSSSAPPPSSTRGEEAPTLAGLPRPRGAPLRDRPPARATCPVMLMTLHAAKGLEFESVFLVGTRGGPPAALAQPRERGGPRGGAAPVLRRHDPRDGEAAPLVGAEPRRLRPAAPHPAEPVPRGGAGRSRSSEAAASCAAPDRRPSGPGRPRHRGAREADLPAWVRDAGRRPQAPAAGPAEAELRPGVRVRHPLFGVGTVLRREGDGRRPQAHGVVPGRRREEARGPLRRPRACVSFSGRASRTPPRRPPEDTTARRASSRTRGAGGCRVGARTPARSARPSA